MSALLLYSEWRNIMDILINTVIFNTGRAIAFNVVLPVWYALIKIFGA